MDRIWTEFSGKKMQHFCCEKDAFFRCFGLDFTFEIFFGMLLDLD